MGNVKLACYSNRHSKKAKRLLWEIVYLCFFRPTPRWCLCGWRRFLLRVFGARIGNGVRIQGGAKIWQPWRITIGDNSWIDGGVYLYSVDDIKIGSNAVISAGAFICTASHDIASETFNLVTKPIELGDSAWVCSRAIVLPGVRIGEGAVVAAGTVVTKDVLPWTVVAGNPGQEVSKRHLAREAH